MKPYSPDLRQRIVSALQQGASNGAVAERFEVSLSTVKRYKGLFQAGQALTAKPIPGRPAHIPESQHQTFRELVASRTDWTLETLSEAWSEQTGVKPTVSVLSDTCKRLRITHKKRHVSPKRGTPLSGRSSSSR